MGKSLVKKKLDRQPSLHKISLFAIRYSLFAIRYSKTYTHIPYTPIPYTLVHPYRAGNN